MVRHPALLAGSHPRTAGADFKHGRSAAGRIDSRLFHARHPGIPQHMILFSATVFTSAFLLFLVQPIIAKQILPWFGGNASVWTVCMVFFQVLLLAGYAYADALSRRVAPRKQAIVHTALLAASLAFLPILAAGAWKPDPDTDPAPRILALLAATIGLPYFLLSTTGPLVQSWFARSFPAGTVYRLFALSNLASLLALVA